MLFLMFAATANAFTIRGTIQNGTTNAPVESAKITLVKPSAGMEDEVVVTATNGHFEIPNVDPNAPIYLLQVDYSGIPYNTPVQVTGQDQTVEITVYESTASWDGIQISVPHLAAVRDGDHMSIEELFQIKNNSTPPRTAYGDEGMFHVFIPAQMDSMDRCFVSSLGVPVDRDPVPTKKAGIYTIDYPIRPGETQIGLSYKVPYPGSFTLSQKILYDIGNITVFAVDPSMKITSSTHTLQMQEGVHGMTAYALPALVKGETLELTFTGGEEHPAGIDASDAGGSDTGAGGGNVAVVPVDTSQLSTFLMMAMLIVLFGLGIVAMRDTHDPLSDPKILRNHYDLLIARLARLDDLRAADTISADAHRAAREDIMSRLSALALRMRAKGTKKSGHADASAPRFHATGGQEYSDPMTSAAALACEKLTKRYGRVAALRSVALSVDTGECVAIFGRNGAGKSTFLQIAGSLIRSYEGTVRIFGQDIKQADIATRRAVGFVLHDTCLYQDLSAMDNLRFFARLYGVDNADARARDMLARVELDHRAASVTRELSRGMKQRLAIARAMIHAPRLLLLDEPFTGLDEISSQSLATMLRDFARDGGTVLMSTHDVERAFPVATRAVILERGQITYDKPTSGIDLAEFRHAYWNVLFTGAPPASAATTGPGASA